MKLKKVFIVSALFGYASLASASEYGCKVLLCLSNPNGPTAVSECVPPIHQLYSDLAHGKGFPTCDLADGNDGNSYAKQGESYYDICPDGTTELTGRAIKGTPPKSNPDAWISKQALYLGIGSGNGLQPDNRSGLPDKICVGKNLGSGSVVIGSGLDARSMPVGFYDKVIVLKPQSSPRIIDVYINNEIVQRVRW